MMEKWRREERNRKRRKEERGRAGESERGRIYRLSSLPLQHPSRRKSISAPFFPPCCALRVYVTHTHPSQHIHRHTHTHTHTQTHTHTHTHTHKMHLLLHFLVPYLAQKTVWSDSHLN